LRLDEERSRETVGHARLDEAQMIKNPESQAAQAAYRLKASWRVTLSGTPVENRLDELWSQMHLLNRGLLGGRRDFQERYAKPVADGVAGAAERLRERIRPFVLRRLKQDVAPELPPRTDSILYCALPESERRVYDAVRAATLQQVVAKLGAGGGVLEALEALLRLRQAACHPALVPGQTAETSAKVERLRESLETVAAEGHKALVFSQWTSLLDLIEPHLTAARSASPPRRVDRGSRGSRRAVSGPRGAAGASDLAEGRGDGSESHRGRPRVPDGPVVEPRRRGPGRRPRAPHRPGPAGLVYRLVAEETVEERILAPQNAKRGIADAALGDAARAASLTRTTLLSLLS
jgi:SNF2 family DNA or RNA helicase